MKNVLNFTWPILLIIALFFLRQILQRPTSSYGAKVYQQHCQNCHMEEGQGLGKLIPPLEGSSYLAEFPSLIPCLIRNGIEGPMQVNGILYDHPMPANPELSDEEIYQLMRFMYAEWQEGTTELRRDSMVSWLEACPEQGNSLNQ
ncbi:MAG: cytochrome c [Bacteroidota bacterium]